MQESPCASYDEASPGRGLRNPDHGAIECVWMWFAVTRAVEEVESTEQTDSDRCLRWHYRYSVGPRSIRALDSSSG